VTSTFFHKFPFPLSTAAFKNAERAGAMAAKGGCHISVLLLSREMSCYPIRSHSTRNGFESMNHITRKLLDEGIGDTKV
jgi:hypothetical protein